MRIGLTAILTGIFLMTATIVALGNDEDFVATGFLGESYSRLQDVKLPSGHKARLWLSPALAQGKYELVLLKKTTYYPGANADDHVRSHTVDEIGAYFNESLYRELSGLLEPAARPGPKTLRFNVAITAVAPEYIKFKLYQFLPFAFFISGVIGVKKGVFLAIEFELLDAETDEIVGAGMLENFGQKLKHPDDELTAEYVKPLIDIWARDLRATLAKATRGE